MLGIDLSIPGVAIMSGGDGIPVPGGDYAPGEVNHPGDASLVRSAAWTGQGAEFGQKTTHAWAFKYEGAASGMAYRGLFGDYVAQLISNNRIEFAFENGSDLNARWQGSPGSLVSGEHYLYVLSMDLSLAVADGFKMFAVNITTGVELTVADPAIWVQGNDYSIQAEPYGIWAHDNGSAPWTGNSIYQAMWPHQFYDVVANKNDWYDAAAKALRDPLGAGIIAAVGTPVFCLEAPAANYTNGVNRSVPGDVLVKQGAGTFTDV